MINRITKRPPKSPERFESMWQGFNSLSCLFGGPPARRVKNKKGDLRKGGVCAETRRGAGQRPSFSRITREMKDIHLVFLGGGPLPRVVEVPRAWSSSRRLGASKFEGNSASRPLARETGGVLRGPCGALRPGGHAPRGPLAARCEAKSPVNSIFPFRAYSTTSQYELQ